MPARVPHACGDEPYASPCKPRRSSSVPHACGDEPRDGANVALNDMGEQGMGHVWLVGEVRVLVCHAQTLV